MNTYIKHKHAKSSANSRINKVCFVTTRAIEAEGGRRCWMVDASELTLHSLADILPLEISCVLVRACAIIYSSDCAHQQRTGCEHQGTLSTPAQTFSDTPHQHHGHPPPQTQLRQPKQASFSPSDSRSQHYLHLRLC